MSRRAAEPQSRRAAEPQSRRAATLTAYLLAAACSPGCGDSGAPPAATSSSPANTASACDSGGECEITSLLPVGLGAQDVAVVARTKLIAGSASVTREKAAGRFGVVASMDSGGVLLHPQARVGEVRSAGSVELQPHATIEGEVTAHAAILLHPGANVRGPQEPFSSIQPFGTTTRLTSFANGPLPSVTVKPHQELWLEPGSYGAVVAQPSSLVRLTTGTYRFESLVIGPGAELSAENAHGPVFVDVRVKLDLAGDVTRAVASRSNVLLSYAGYGAVALAGSVRATILAPHADVALSAVAPPMTGAIFGKSVTLGAGTTVIHEPFFDERCDAAGRCTPRVPIVRVDGGANARYMQWQTPVAWPGVRDLVTSVRAAQEACEAASSNCQNAIDACAYAAPVGGYSCADVGITCGQANVACSGLRDRPAAPGFTQSTDPLLRFLLDPDMAEILGFEPATTAFRFDRLSESGAGPIVQYRQHALVQVQGSPSLVPVLGASVAIQLTPDSAGVAGVASHVADAFDVAPALTLIGETSAVEAAREYLALREMPIPEVLPAPESVRFFGARMEEDEDGRRDRLVYSLAMGLPRAPSLAWLYFLIDARTGTVLYSGASTPEVASWNLFLASLDETGVVPLSEKGLLNVENLAICGLKDGHGPDRFGVDRKISTSRFWDKSVFPADLTWGTASCPEGIDRDFIQTNDVVTFHPAALGPQKTLYPTVDPDKIHTDPNNTFSTPSAVEAHYWGEHVVRWFHRRGLYHRDTPPTGGCVLAVGQDLSQFATNRIRHLSVSDVGGSVTNNAFWLPHTKLPGPTYCTLSWFNGLALYGKGDGSFRRSATDPAVVAHEFFHSVIWDSVNKGEEPTGATRDFKAIDEGLADCFAMIFTHDRLGDISSVDPTNPNLKPDPFHVGRGVYVDPVVAAKGAPNLENPADSAGTYVYKTWRADRCAGSTCLAEDAHWFSTMVSAACKTLITGVISSSNLATSGTNPDPKFAAIAVVPHPKNLPESASLGANGLPANTVDEGEAFDRLAEVLIETVTQRLSPNADFHSLIDAMALSADHLGSTAWTSAGDVTHAYGERVRRAFSVYGFGRGVEKEPNDASLIDNLTEVNSKDGTHAARNLIAANHKGWSRTIQGQVGLEPQGQKPIGGCSGSCSNTTTCKLDADFFVLNELVRPGDSIDFSITTTKQPEDAPRFRVRIFHTKACEGFNDSPDKNSALSVCQKGFQIYPAHDDPNDRHDQPAPKSASVKMPGSGDAGRVVYIGVMPVSYVPCGNYDLKVSISRRTPAPY